jgi:hypothetical protein
VQDECETWSVTLRQKTVLDVYDIKVLMSTFGHYKEEEEKCRKTVMLSWQFVNFTEFCWGDQIKDIGTSGYVGLGGNILVRKPEGKELLERLEPSSEDTEGKLYVCYTLSTISPLYLTV